MPDQVVLSALRGLVAQHSVPRPLDAPFVEQRWIAAGDLHTVRLWSPRLANNRWVVPIEFVSPMGKLVAAPARTGQGQALIASMLLCDLVMFAYGPRSEIEYRSGGIWRRTVVPATPVRAPEFSPERLVKGPDISLSYPTLAEDGDAWVVEGTRARRGTIQVPSVSPLGSIWQGLSRLMVADFEPTRRFVEELILGLMLDFRPGVRSEEPLLREERCGLIYQIDSIQESGCTFSVSRIGSMLTSRAIEAVDGTSALLSVTRLFRLCNQAATFGCGQEDARAEVLGLGQDAPVVRILPQMALVVGERTYAVDIGGPTHRDMGPFPGEVVGLPKGSMVQRNEWEVEMTVGGRGVVSVAGRTPIDALNRLAVIVERARTAGDWDDEMFQRKT